MMMLRWLVVLPQIVIVCTVDHVLDLMFPSRKPGTLVIDLNNWVAWIDKSGDAR
jgi:hypothetical protein